VKSYKCLVCIIFFTIVPFCLFAKDFNKEKFSLCTDFNSSIQYGSLGEYVFDLDSSDNTFKKLSYLDWDLKPSTVLGLNFIGGYKNLYVSPYISFGIPGECGKMQDSDWLDLNSVKNDYSISINTLNKNIFTGIQLEYRIPLSTLFYFAPAISFDYQYISFSAKDGYGWYGDSVHSTTGTNVSYDSEYAKQYDVGELMGIDYMRSTFYLWTGFSSELTVSKKISFGCMFFFSPYTQIYSLDKHFSDLQRNSYAAYNDIMEGYLSYFKFRMYLNYSFSSSCSLLLSVNELVGSSGIGITLYYSGNATSNSQPAKLSSKSKSDIDVPSVSLAFRICFF